MSEPQHPATSAADARAFIELLKREILTTLERHVKADAPIIPALTELLASFMATAIMASETPAAARILMRNQLQWLSAVVLGAGTERPQ